MKIIIAINNPAENDPGTPKKQVSSQEIMDIIRALSKGRNLMGGNCGVFANAMARYLTSQGIPVQLVFIGNSPDGSYDEHDLYHVVIKANGVYYDGSGQIGDLFSYVDNFSTEQYGNPSPSIHAANFDPETAREARINTNYSVSEDALYNEITRIAQGMVKK